LTRGAQANRRLFVTTRLATGLCALLAVVSLVLAGAGPGAATGPEEASCCGNLAPCAEGGALDCASRVAVPCCEARPPAAATRTGHVELPTAPPPSAGLAAFLARLVPLARALPDAPVLERAPLRTVVLLL
jgi:hypothetical protein